MKVGIITHYYLSYNYGGNLQAYALCRYINKLGYSAEQICYDRNAHRTWSLHKLLSVGFHFCKALISTVTHPLVYRKKTLRKQAITEFNQGTIHHSDKVFTDANINEIATRYDVLITGSDQVWHPSAVCDTYLLDFHTKSDCKKMSYAASCAIDCLSEETKVRYKEALKDYSAVSVREKSAVDLISPLSPVEVSLVLDPVFLLDKDEWDTIVPERRIRKKYVFCYFLGESTLQRTAAKDYATNKDLELVTMPCLSEKYRNCDSHYGSIQVWDASPAEFISLIKHAECVFTDSFHATAFSLIYHKQYFVFERPSKESMGSRIRSISEIFGTLDRYCDTPNKENLDFLLNINEIDYSTITADSVQKLADSTAFLKRNLSELEKTFHDHQP